METENPWRSLTGAADLYCKYVSKLFPGACVLKSSCVFDSTEPTDGPARLQCSVGRVLPPAGHAHARSGDPLRPGRAAPATAVVGV